MVDLPRRHDHFSQMRAQPEPETEVPAVTFSPDQLEYLEKQFGALQQLSLIKAAKEINALVHAQGKGEGFSEVLKHIETLTKRNA